MRTRVNRFSILIIIPLFLLAYSFSSGKSLSKCAANGDNRCLEELIAKGEDINAYDEWGWTPLLWAVYYGKLKTVKLLVIKGTDVNVRTMKDCKGIPKNSTVLIICATYDYTDIAYLLIKNGAIDYMNRDGKSAYSIARDNESAPMLKLLNKDFSGIDLKRIEETAIATRPNSDDLKASITRNNQLGFGFSIGTPSILNFVAGGYFSHFGVQFSGTFTGVHGWTAIQLDAMYLFKNEQELKYGISLMGDLIFIPSVWGWYGIGLSTYINYHGYFLKSGLSLNDGSYGDTIGIVLYKKVKFLPMIQI